MPLTRARSAMSYLPVAGVFGRATGDDLLDAVIFAVGLALSLATGLVLYRPVLGLLARSASRPPAAGTARLADAAPADPAEPTSSAPADQADPTGAAPAKQTDHPSAAPARSVRSGDTAPIGSALARATPGRAPGVLRIGVLGPLSVNGQPGALLPAQSQLLLALALNGEAGLSNSRLCQFLGPDSAHPRPPQSLRRLIVRTRRTLGQAADGREWIMHLGHGRYALHPAAVLDLRQFEAMTSDPPAGQETRQLTDALALVRGAPFTGCYYWWLETTVIESAIASITEVAHRLSRLLLHAGEPALAVRAVRMGLTSDPSAEELWRVLMRAEHAAGNLAGVREAWSRARETMADIAADGRPEDATVELYRTLVDQRLPEGYDRRP